MEDTKELLLSFLREGTKFLIVSHQNPDADCLTSSIAMKRCLEFFGKHVMLLNQGDFTRSEIKSYEPLFTKDISLDFYKTHSDFRVLLIDCNSFKRCGDRLELPLSEFKNYAVIDHHLTLDGDGNGIIYIDKNAPSSSVLVMNVIQELGYKLEYEDAYLIFKGFSFDTGFFRFLNNNQYEWLDNIKKLMQLGISLKEMYLEFYSVSNMLEKKFLAKMLINTEEYCESKLLLVVCNKEDSIYFRGARDTDSLYENLFQTGAEMIVYLREDERDENRIFCSLRSKYLDTTLISFKMGGGGHKNASGFKAQGKLKEIKNNVLQLIEENSLFEF